MQSIKFLPASSQAANPSLATVQTLRSPGASDIIVNTVTGFPSFFFATMGTPHTFTDPVTGETITVISEASAVDFAGHLNSGKITIDAIAPGYADTAGSKVGDIIIVRPISAWADNLFNILNAGAHNDDGTLAVTALDAFFKPVDIIHNSIVSGGVIAQTTLLTASFSDIVFYWNGLRQTKTGVANRAYTPSKDTYVDISNTGVLTYVEVANGATVGMTLTANSLRLAKVVTNGSTITSVVQYGSDPLANAIYPVGVIGAKNIDFSSIGSAAYQNMSPSFPTSSTSYVSMTGAAVTLIKGSTQSKLKISIHLNNYATGSAGNVSTYGVQINSVDYDVMKRFHDNLLTYPFTGEIIIPAGIVPAGSVTVQMRHKVSANGVTIDGNGFVEMIVEEI